MKKYSIRFVCFLAISIFIIPTPCLSAEKTTLSKTKQSAESRWDEYRIGNGDILEIVTWKEPDFSGEVIVRLDGKITFPLLDDIQAANRTTVQVKEDIQSRLKEYIEGPIVTVILKNPVAESSISLGKSHAPGNILLLRI